MSFTQLNGHSQIKFEEGYFIDSNNIRTECLIKNLGWDNNPIDFQFKLSMGSEIKNLDISETKEFAIYGKVKFIRATVEIDQSSMILDRISSQESPLFEKDQVFLRVLQEGDANLYYYSSTNLIQYFYSKDTLKYEPLIFKPYIKYINDKKVVAYNTTYQSQLTKIFNNVCVGSDEISKVEYDKNGLSRIFKKYNSCNSNSNSYSENLVADNFNLTVRAGMNISSLSVSERLTFSEREASLSSKGSFRFGVEFEYVFTSGQNKYSAFIEPTFQNYKNEEIVNGFYYNVDYTTIDLPIGIRYSTFLNDDFNIFFNLAYIIGFDLDSKFETRQEVNFEIPKRKILLGNRTNPAVGLGLEYEQHSLELRYQFSSNILQNSGWDSKFKTIGFIYGYRVF